MVRKIATASTGVAISLLIPLVVFLMEKRQYLYPVTCDFKFIKWLFVCSIVLVFEASVYFAIKCFLKKKIINIIIAILLCLTLIPQIILGSFFIGIFSGTNWQSSTQNTDNFGTIDPYFDSQFEICGLKMSEIMAIEPLRVNRYDYNYQSELAAISFDVFFEIELSEENYTYLKEIFQNDLKYETNENQHQCDNVDCGKLVLSNDTATTIDKWDEMYIEYCDSARTFSAKFKGVCYT